MTTQTTQRILEGTPASEPQTDEFTALREEVERLRNQMDTLLAALTPQPPEQTVCADSPAPLNAEVIGDDQVSETEHQAHDEGKTSRRALLKWGGLGAAAAIATAGGTALTSPSAHAANGGNMILGNTNYAENPTVLNYNGASTPINGALYVNAVGLNLATAVGAVVGNSSTGVLGSAGSDAFAVGVQGNVSGTGTGVSGKATGNGTGVSGTAGGTGHGVHGVAGDYGAGVYGIAGAAGSGVFGTAGNFGAGVTGYGSGAGAHGVSGTGFQSSNGVYGESDSGTGVYATSSTGVALRVAGNGVLWQNVAAAYGPPTTGNHFTGEQIRDKNGGLYLCVAGGTPGAWQKVAALDTAYRGGAIGFLSTPIRVYDSRSTGGALIGNATRDVQVTSVTINSVKVPAGASGCIGNLTVTGATASGYVVIYPQGSGTPTSSTVNFVGGQTVANAFAVGLSVSGQVTVHSFTHGQCHFIVDITGFVS